MLKPTIKFWQAKQELAGDEGEKRSELTLSADAAVRWRAPGIVRRRKMAVRGEERAEI